MAGSSVSPGRDGVPVAPLTYWTRSPAVRFSMGGADAVVGVGLPTTHIPDAYSETPGWECSWWFTAERYLFVCVRGAMRSWKPLWAFCACEGIVVRWRSDRLVAQAPFGFGDDHRRSLDRRSSNEVGCSFSVLVLFAQTMPAVS